MIAVDNEIAKIAGPQLVVPVDNARYALNAANARWGSLYNALYGTDIIPGSIEKSWDQERAKKVINFVRDFLDERIPLAQTSWKNVSKFKIEENKTIIKKKIYLACLVLVTIFLMNCRHFCNFHALRYNFKVCFRHFINTTIMVKKISAAQD